MSFDFSSVIRKLSPSPQPKPHALNDPSPRPVSPRPGPSLSPSPSPRSADSSSTTMTSPGTTITSPHNGIPITPSHSSSSSSPTSHPNRPASPPIPQHSPVDLFQHVDPRYPDIIATLSNALHYLNKTGFDHDVQHHHTRTSSNPAASSTQSPVGSDDAREEDDEEPSFSAHSDGGGAAAAGRQPYAVRVEDNEYGRTAQAAAEGDEEGDIPDGMITPGGSDSEEEYSSDDDTRATGGQHRPHVHGAGQAHRRSRSAAGGGPSAMGTHADAMQNHAEVDDSRGSKHDSDFQQSKDIVVPTAYPDVEAVQSPPKGGDDPYALVHPQHGQTAPAKSAGTFPSSSTADLVPTDSSPTSPPATAGAASRSSPVLSSSSSTAAAAPAVRNIVSITGQPLPAREAAILAGAKRASHRHSTSEVPSHYLTPQSATQSHSGTPPTIPGSPSPASPRSPGRASPFRPRSLSTSAPSPSPPAPNASSPSFPPSSPTISAGPPGSTVDIQESTKTETTESTTESETDAAKSVQVTTTTVTTHVVVRTTTMPKHAAPTDTAVVWTPSEQSQLLEEILIFYVDLYWENQHAFAPFYKQKMDTHRDKALMIYRHLFQDEKFKSQSKKLLKAPLVDFFEQQLAKKAQGSMGAGRQPGMLTRTGPQDDAARLMSPTSESYNHNHFAPPMQSGGGDMMSPVGGSSTPGSQTGSGASTPSTLAPPSSSPPAEKRRSSFSLPNPLALFSPAPKEPTAEEVEIEAYLTRVNQVAADLHRQYLKVSTEINRQIVEHLLTPDLPPHITCANDLNRAMVKLLHSPQILAQLSVYHPMYQDAVVGFPGRVLMSRTLRHRVESPSLLEFNFTDMIVAVNELTEILRKAFQKLASNHPHMIARLVASQRLMSLRDLHAEYSAERERKRDKGGYAESFSSWLYDSRVYPKLFNPSTFHILQTLHIKDAKTFHHLSEHRLQEALWRLKDLNLDEQAVTLERLINDEILGDQQANIADVENLGGGFTTTKLINFPTQDVRGVYKPKSGSVFSVKNGFKLQNFADSIVSNYKKEIAAYRIDQLLKLNHVPITKLTDVHGEKGSLQYFIADATVARMVNDVDVNNPHKSGKWTSSRGRTELPRSIKMFDWFINNRDRNLDNYLISDDGRVILIDHGWTFVAPTTSVTKDFLKKLIPKESIYLNVKALHDNEKLVDDELKDLLGPRNLAAFKNRLKTFVHFVEKRIAKKGREETFREAEIEDWKPDVSK